MPRWMSIWPFIGVLAIWCMACTPAGQKDQAAAPAETPKMVEVAQPAPLPDTFPPLASRNLNDMVAGCPHQNPTKRPRGSNCFGIFPEQCGADKAKAFIGQSATPALRERLRSFTTAEFPRFIKPSEPVTDDLRYGRLNVHMDQNEKIVSVDCY